MEPGTPFSREQEYWIASYLDARLKGTRHPNADHPDRALLPQKLKPSGTGDDLLATSDDGKDSEWRSVSDLGVATAASVTAVQAEVDALETEVATNYAKLDGSNDPFTGNLEVGTHATNKAEFGTWPAAVGSAFFGHAALDHSVTGNYALVQTSAGTTAVNAPSGQTVLLRINNTTVMTIAATAATMAQPIAMGSNKITGLAEGTANGDAIRYEQLVGVYAPLASPALTGTPTAPTAAVDTNTTQVATTAFVVAQITDDAIKKTIVDAKGDILVGTASDTPAVLSVGSNGTVPVANSGDTAGIGWAIPSYNHSSNFQAVAPTILSSTVEPMLCSSSHTIIDGNAVFCAVYLPYDVTLNGVGWYQVVQGSTTGDNNNKVGLYTSDGTTLTRVAASTTDSNLWDGAANSVKTKDFSSTYAAQAGLYYIAFLGNWSAVATSPTIAAVPILIHSGIHDVATTGSSKHFGVVTGQTDLDATEAWSGAASLGTAAPWLFIY